MAIKQPEPRDPRVVIQKEFSSVDEFVDQYIKNISRTGAFIVSRNPLPVGTTVDLKFTIAEDDLIRIEGVGEVVRTEDGHVKGMGVIFIMLTQHSHDALARLLTRRLTPGRGTKRKKRSGQRS